MSMRTWSVTYDDSAGELSLFIDATHIETLKIPPLFPDKTIFGKGAIEFLVTGVNSYVSDDGGDVALVPMSDIDGFFGQFGSLQLWDRALNASEIHQISASPNNLTGDEDGLCIYWPADRGHGSRVSNLGSAGGAYDAVLGQYAAGARHTSAVYGTGCDAVSTTSPAWANMTAGLNTPPIAENITLEVRK